MDLNDLRQKISGLDKKLLQTLKERFDVAREIGKMKKDHMYDPQREHELLAEWLAQGLDENFTRALFHMVVNESRSLMMEKNS